MGLRKEIAARKQKKGNSGFGAGDNYARQKPDPREFQGTASASDDHQLLKEIAARKQKAESPEGCFGIGTGDKRRIAHEERLNLILTEEEQTQDRSVWQSFNEAQGKGS